jgi:hypothetical protein
MWEIFVLKLFFFGFENLSVDALFKLDYSELNYSFLIKVLQDSVTQE